MSVSFELKGVEELEESLQEAVKLNADKVEETLIKEGTHFKKTMREVTRATIKKEHTGKLVKGYRITRPHGYGMNTEVDFIGETRKNPHFHLVENGHELVTKKGKVIGFVPGKHLVDKGVQQYGNSLIEALDKTCDEILNRSGL